jgi:heme/copper-type cytochrome/quinol oxidase subunit 3
MFALGLVRTPGGGDRSRGASGPAVPGRFSARTLVILLLLASLVVGFAPALLAYLYFYFRADAWPPPGAPRIPRALWLSTLLMVAGAATVQYAVRCARADRPRALRGAMVAAVVLAVAFLVSQCVNLFAVLLHYDIERVNKVVALFFVLVGLHALHLIGGLVPLVWTAINAHRERYSSRSYAGVRYCAWYWHFLDLLWLLIFALLIATNPRS